MWVCVLVYLEIFCRLSSLFTLPFLHWECVELTKKKTGVLGLPLNLNCRFLR